AGGDPAVERALDVPGARGLPAVGHDHLDPVTGLELGPRLQDELPPAGLLVLLLPPHRAAGAALLAPVGPLPQGLAVDGDRLDVQATQVEAEGVDVLGGH